MVTVNAKGAAERMRLVRAAVAALAEALGEVGRRDVGRVGALRRDAGDELPAILQFFLGCPPIRNRQNIPGFRPGWAVAPVRGQAEPLKTAKDRFTIASHHRQDQAARGAAEAGRRGAQRLADLQGQRRVGERPAPAQGGRGRAGRRAGQ